ncbi:helix-turn-helix domain-containing protein [Aquimarina algiphila]|uniref:helix-turn-helix domain-containing protein n=1 Tax=Aquimarina algiphila TaxID=2047982 RepID=UPI00232C1F28|nr:helix-turn-helix domain-containing protein [Aquimarina algiphila]
MIKKYTFLGYLLILFVYANQVYGQNEKEDKNQNDLGYTQLKALIANQKTDSLKVKTLQSYLSESKSRADTLGMANAYFFLAHVVKEAKLQYADSLIGITKDKKYINYPAKGYLLQGNTQYELGNYIEALELYLIASEAAKKNGNQYLYRSIKFNIGLLKNNAGEREEAQVIFLEHLNFLDQNPKFKSPSDYNRALFALTDSYIYSSQFSEAKSYIDQGIRQTLKVNDTSIYSSFVMYSGMYEYFSKNYKTAIDSLEKGKDIIKNFDEVKTRMAICDYYIARSYRALGNNESSISYFKNVDHILKKTEDVIPELIDTYDYLIADSELKNDLEKQIEYINTLLRLDSIRHANQIYLTKNINERYDTAELIAEKEKLINELQEETFLKEETIAVLILFLITLVILVVYFFYRSYANKKRFLNLLEEQKNKDQGQPEFTAISNTISKKEEIDIPEEVIATVLKKLHGFEESVRFSKKQYTLNLLAKELQTNSAYLSKIINVHKNMNFANYLNNLRVDFAVGELTTDKALRSYTIKAIAEEVGFKNAQSFSSAFHKRTGIYPSYFIKQLNNG